MIKHQGCRDAMKGMEGRSETRLEILLLYIAELCVVVVSLRCFIRLSFPAMLPMLHQITSCREPHPR